MAATNILLSFIIVVVTALICGIIGKKAGHGKAGSAIGLALGVFVDIFVVNLPVGR